MGTGKNFTGVIRWAPSFTGVSLIGPRHLHRAQRRHLASQVCPPLLLPLHAHFAAQLGSFLLIHSQLLLRSAASDSDLMALRDACPRTPIPLRSLVVDVATKPLHPTSTGSTWARQPRCSASAAMSEYFSRFRSYASPTAASHGTVSSTMNTAFWEVDHKTRSGLRLVVTISGGKTSFLSRSTSILQSRAESRMVVSALADGFAESCPALTKGVVFECLGIGGGRALLMALLPSRVIASCLRTWLCIQV